MEQGISIVVWAAIIQGIFLAMLFISSKQHHNFSNKLLGFFLLSLIFEAILAFSTIDSIFGYPINRYFELPEPKILIPLFFLHYILEKLGRTDTYLRFLKINYIIAGIVVVITVINVALFLLNNNSIYDYWEYQRIENVFLIQQTYAFILSVVGLFIAISETIIYKNRAQNDFSDLDLLEISWLWNFIFLLVPATILWGAEIVRIFIGRYKGEFTSWNFVDITWGVLTIFIYFVSFKAFRHKDLNLGHEQKNAAKKVSDEAEFKLTDELEQPLLHCMRQDKMFIKSDLTIFEVAKNLGATTRKVSICINSNFRTNFSEWVNSFRVNEVKRRFDDNAANHLTIEAIGQESGFKSRSAMYSAFKKSTGHTPAHFRKSDLS